MFNLTQQMIYNINVNVGVGFLGSQIFYLSKQNSINSKKQTNKIIYKPITLNNPNKASTICTSY